MGFVLNVYFIVPIWIKWNNQPTLTTLGTIQKVREQKGGRRVLEISNLLKNLAEENGPQRRRGWQKKCKILSSQFLNVPLDSTNHPVWEIDFPAVTICSPNKVVKRKLESLANSSPWVPFRNIYLQYVHRVSQKDYDNFDSFTKLGYPYSRNGVISEEYWGGVTKMEIYII